MKTIEISKGGTTAFKIQLHDQELSVVVHDAVAVEVKKLPVRMLYKGQMVRNLEEDDQYVKKGATGTVDEDDKLPWVIWDSADMLTDRGQCEDRRWKQAFDFLEVIEEVSEAHAHIAIDAATSGEYTGGTDDEPKEIRIPFDISRMAEAIRFETRDGREVKCVVVHEVEAEYPVTGYVNGAGLLWTKKGQFAITGIERPQDLFMVVKEVRND
jgi:hypothetical protein